MIMMLEAGEWHSPNTTSFGGQQEHSDIGIVRKVINNCLPLVCACRSVQPRVLDIEVIEGDLENVQNHDELRWLSLTSPVGELD